MKEKTLVTDLMTRLSILILTIGIPGAGKTCWVREYTAKHHATIVISTDVIRKELTGTSECNPQESWKIHEEARRRVKEILDHPDKYGYPSNIGPEIIVDSTNVEVDEWRKYKSLNPSLMYAKIFDVPPEIAMAHQITGRKERIVPKEILEMKWKQLEENRQYLPLFFNFILR